MRWLRFSSLALLALTSIVSRVPAIAAGVPAAQGDPEYLALLARYAEGDVEEPVETLSGWPDARVRSAVRALGRPIAAARPKAVVMLHTEAAFGSRQGRVAGFHIDVARRFLPRPIDDRTRTFAARWHGLIALLYAMRNREKDARLEIGLGFAIDSKNKDAALAQGVLLEQAIRRSEPNLRGQWYGSQGAATGRLTEVSQHYRAALADHPEFLEARLRLGWVASLNASPQVAREALGLVATRATRADVQYLAHLFLGALDEQARRFDDAIRQYEAAYSISPGQAVVVSLVRLETRRGNFARARQVGTAFADRPVTVGDDPWQRFSAGLTSGELVEWLRTEAAAR